MDLAQPRSSTVTPAPRAGQTTRRQAKTGGAQELLDVVSPPFGASDVCPGAGDVCPGAFDVWPVTPVLRTAVFSAGAPLRSAPAGLQRQRRRSVPLRSTPRRRWRCNPPSAPLRVAPALKTAVLRTSARAKRLQLQAKRHQLQAKRLQLQTPGRPLQQLF